MNIGIIDADLIARKKHRFPNLALMKISGWHKELGDAVTLLTEWGRQDEYDKIYLSKVFTDTEVPEEVLTLPNLSYGGTGFYFDKAPNLPDEIEHHMPDYNLYNNWIDGEIVNANEIAIKQGKTFDKKKFMVQFKEYTNYSIGFLTRGCFRKCAFCVNQKYDHVFKHSPLEEFYDPSRKKICLLDDNFLGYSGWEDALLSLKETNKPFKFKQGLDARILTEKKCELLFSSKYDDHFTFAFDNIADYGLIENKLQMIRKYTNKVCKFYVFCGFDRSNKWDDEFWYQDIIDVFIRVELLMKYKCVPYIMRFNRYVESPYKCMYINLARWCNQPSMFKKKSYEEFCAMQGSSIRCLEEFLATTSFKENYNHFITMKY